MVEGSAEHSGVRANGGTLVVHELLARFLHGPVQGFLKLRSAIRGTLNLKPQTLGRSLLHLES